MVLCCTDDVTWMHQVAINYSFSRSSLEANALMHRKIFSLSWHTAIIKGLPGTILQMIILRWIFALLQPDRLIEFRKFDIYYTLQTKASDRWTRREACHTISRWDLQRGRFRELQERSSCNNQKGLWSVCQVSACTTALPNSPQHKTQQQSTINHSYRTPSRAQ